MTRRVTPRPPALRDYIAPKAVPISNQAAWHAIRQWQRDGLVSVRPDSKNQATVELTEKGKKQTW